MKNDSEEVIIEVVEETGPAGEPAAEKVEEKPEMPQEPAEAPDEEIPSIVISESAVPNEETVVLQPEAEPSAVQPEAVPESEAPVRQQLTEKKPVHITEPGRLPLSLAIETDGGLVSRIAQIGDVLPVKCTREFSTSSNAIRAVALNLYAGERPVAAQNRLIAKLKISGIEKLPAGRPVITVNFEIDRDAAIHVEALDEGSLRGCTKTIDNSWKPSDEEIYEIVRDAQDNLTDDNKIRERSRLLRNARECLFRADYMLRAKKKTLSREQSREIREKSKRLSQRLKKQNVLDMEELSEKAITDAVNSLDSALRAISGAK